MISSSKYVFTSFVERTVIMDLKIINNDQSLAPFRGDLEARVYNLENTRKRILKDGEDKKTLFAVIALVTAVLIAVTVGVVYLLKTKMDDEYEEDWDYDWDDLEDDFCDDECCCTDNDVDDSVKVEQA